MILKAPSYDWTDQCEYFVEEDENLSEFDDEPDFSEYMWMENEEEFDQNELKRLEEEEIMQECMEAMIEDELIEAEIAEIQRKKNEEFNEAIAKLKLGHLNIQNSLLNPLAAEFVPQSQPVDPGLS